MTKERKNDFERQKVITQTVFDGIAKAVAYGIGKGMTSAFMLEIIGKIQAQVVLFKNPNDLENIKKDTEKDMKKNTETEDKK